LVGWVVGVVVEHGVVRRRCRGCLRVGVLFPGPYGGMVASLAVHILYYLLNSLDGVVAERFCVGRGCPRGRSLESGAPLRGFDVIFASVGYEGQLGLLVRGLVEGGVEPRRVVRGRVGGPLVVVGGVGVMGNPLPVSVVADAVGVGEVEVVVPGLVECLVGGGGRGCLEGLAGRGLFVPGFGVARRVWVGCLDDAFHPVLEFRVPGSGEPWGEAFLVEVSRGCCGMCSFCMESRLMFPLRHRSFGVLRRLIVEGVRVNGVGRVAFYSLNLLSRRDVGRLLGFVVDELGLGVSAGSLRVEAVDEELLGLLARGGQRVATLAPEVLVERLQRVTWKRFSLERLEWAVSRVVGLGMHPKLYLLTGLPGEGIGDVEAGARVLRGLYRLSGGRLRVSLNPLIPKPWTPLQWVGLLSRGEYERRVRVYSRAAPVDALPWREAALQLVIARGGVEVGEAVVEAVLGHGRLSFGLLRGLLARRGVDVSSLLGPLPVDEDPPWSRVVDVGVPVASLRRGFEALVSGAG